MRAGWRATRRNRNLGAAWQGHGRDGPLVIPRARPPSRPFWDVLRGPVVVHRTVGGTPLTVLVEPPRADAFHACTVDDVCRVLAHAPPGDLNGIDLIVLRQPTRKQQLLRPVWGRMTYGSDTGRQRGPALFLEAQALRPLPWSLSLDPEDAAELERLRADGHRVVRTRRGHRLEPTPASIRATQLFRTLLHELGHWADWARRVLRPAADGVGRDGLAAAYRALPRRTKEDFAHRYAAEVGANVPRFAQLVEPWGMRADGLDPAWFRPPA